MSEPRYQRRKEDRPAEITAAAFDTFTEKGYAGTRVAEVAARAGVSKGLLYLYFKTKEELFKSVVKSFVVPKLDALQLSIDTTDLSAEAFLRGPFLEFARSLPASRVSNIVRLLIAEGPKHPDLLQFYWDNVVSRGIAAIQSVLDRGVANGEFRRSPLTEQPLLFVMPAVFTVIFQLLFSQQNTDTERLIETQIDLVVNALRGVTP